MPRSPSLPAKAKEHKYPEILFRGLDDKTKDEWKRLLHHSALIDRVVDILKEWEAENDTIQRDDYESPAWACKQADRNGVARTLKKLINLLDHKEV